MMPNRNTRLPWIGTANAQRMIARISAVSPRPSTRYGATLPSIRPSGSTGVTISCSMVPFSRSRTTEPAAQKERDQLHQDRDQAGDNVVRGPALGVEQDDRLRRQRHAAARVAA